MFETVSLGQLLRDLIDVESVSGNETEIANRVADTLSRQEHLEVTRIDNVVIARTGHGCDRNCESETTKPYRVVIAGHLDTVPVAGNLPSSEDETRIFGRGACDMKGGIAVMLAAAVALTDPKYHLTWIFYDNEEVEAEKNGLYRLSQRRPELLSGDFAILMEPTSAGIEGGCQGTLRVEVQIPGVAAHSARSWHGDNAIHKAGQLLQKLADYQPRTVIVDGLEYREGLNAVKISGGIAGNVIPDNCVITVNFRFAPDRDEANARAFIAEFFNGYQYHYTDFSPAARPGLDRSLAQEFAALVPSEPRAKYGWTDVARFSALGIPAVNFGPGDPNLAHTVNENCDKADLDTCYQALVTWLSPKSTH